MTSATLKNGSRSAAAAKVTVGLIQINHLYAGQRVLPYSIGLLQAYAETHARSPGKFRFNLPIYERQPIAGIVASLAGCDVVGFSTYVWNARISLEIARRLRVRSPKILIIFGGPHVPNHAEVYLKQHPFIDIAVHGEGEPTFLALLEQYPAIDPTKIAGVSAIGRDGAYLKTPNALRLRDLDEVPSPFLTGVFDGLMQAAPQQRWVALWETNRGCPFQCTFCDWGSATASKVSQFGLERLQREVDWFAAKHVEVVYCCDANFGILKRDIEIATYAAEKKRESGFPKILSVQNTKNATERAYQTQKILSDAGLSNGIALAMQSLDPVALRSIKRDNISLETFDTLQHRFMSSGVDTYSDLILGLPGETYASFVAGLNTLIERGQHTRVRFNNLSVLPNAEMGDPAYQERYGMVTVESRLIILPSGPDAAVDDVPELQDLVIASATMPRHDWRRTRVFAWMTTLLYFDKLVQIPFVLAHATLGVRYTDLIEAVIRRSPSLPVLSKVRAFFEAEAQAIQEGRPEYPFSEQWLSMYWPTDEYAYIALLADGALDALCAEVETITREHLQMREGDDLSDALADAFLVNRLLLKRPFVSDDVDLDTRYNVMDVYSSAVSGRAVPLRREQMRTFIARSEEAYADFGDWCREVVIRGKQKGAYFYRFAQRPGQPETRPPLHLPGGGHFQIPPR